MLLVFLCLLLDGCAFRTPVKINQMHLKITEQSKYFVSTKLVVSVVLCVMDDCRFTCIPEDAESVHFDFLISYEIKGGKNATYHIAAL